MIDENKRAANTNAVEQVKLTKEAIASTRNLFKGMETLTRAILDLTEAVDTLHEEMGDISEQLGGVKIDVSQTTEETVEEPPSEGASDVGDIDPPNRG